MDILTGQGPPVCFSEGECTRSLYVNDWGVEDAQVEREKNYLWETKILQISISPLRKLE